MATASDKLQLLHPDIIRHYLETGRASGIGNEVIALIDKLDSIPELYRRYQNPTKTARELISLYPELFNSFQTARGLVYVAINFFHLNAAVKNEAWDNLYADRFDELAAIEAKRGNIESAKRIYTEAHRLRTLRNDDKIDANLLHPVVHVLSPEASDEMLGIDKDYNLKELWTDVKVFVKHRVTNVDDDQKEAILREAKRSLNIDDTTFEDITEQPD